MKSWNPFGRIDMEIGSFLKASPFNKEYQWGKTEESGQSEKADKKGK